MQSPCRAAGIIALKAWCMGLLQNYFFCPELFLSPIEAQALKGRQKGITANNFLR